MEDYAREQYAGLDVSLKSVSICVVDVAGRVEWRGEVVNEPAVVAQSLRRRAPRLARVVLETGSCGIHLYRDLQARGFAVVCICARHAKGVLKCKVNKSDANDAEGLAQLARTGWYRAVYVKSAEAQAVRAHLLARRQVCKARRDFENQIRALLRSLGLKVGTVSRGRFEERVRRLVEQAPALRLPVEQLLQARHAVLLAQDQLEAAAKRLATTDDRCRRLQTMPGVGPLTALAFVSVVDGPARFAKSSSIGAYLGLNPRGYQSGEVAWSGHISKSGDAIARALLYEAANSLMVRVKAWPPLKRWAHKLAERVGGKKARVALARKMAVILHRMLSNGTSYHWTAETA